MSCETGVSPIDLIDAPDGMLDEMIAYLNWRAEQRKKAEKARRK